MSKPLVPDELWDTIEPLLPVEPPKPKGGRPRVPDRACLTGIIFVRKTGLPWEDLPAGAGLRRGHDLLAAAARRAGRPECGIASTGRCWTAWAQPTRSTGSGPAWTRPASRPKRGGRHRPRSDESRQTGHEAPSCGRPPRYPARRAPDRGQPPRRRPVRGAGRRDPPDQAALRAAAASARRSCTPTRRTTGARAGPALSRRHIKVRIARKGVDVQPAPGAPPLGGRADVGRGSIGSGACASATNVATTSTTPSSPSAARSSAATPSTGIVRCSK